MKNKYEKVCAMKYEKDCAENFSPFYCALVSSANTHCGIESSASPLPKLAVIQNNIFQHLILTKIHYAKRSLLVFQINVSSSSFYMHSYIFVHGVATALLETFVHHL